MPFSAPPTSTRPRRRSGRHGAVASAIIGAVALSGCITGERPVLEPEPDVADPAIAAVLDRLDRAESSSFTAEYDIIPSTTGVATPATVRRLESGRTLVTIGAIEYLVDGSVTRTCVGDDCVGRIDDARVSDLNVTHRFWGASFAARLELDAARNLRAGQGRVDTISGQPATCVDVDVVGGTVTYCALDVGGLARYFGADVSIELTSYSSRVDVAAFED